MAFSTASGVVQANEVNVYSYRQPFLIKPIFDAFSKETGIEVNTVFAKKGLVERLKSEGDLSPADLIFTVDLSRLQQAVDEGVTQPVGLHSSHRKLLTMARQQRRVGWKD